MRKATESLGRNAGALALSVLFAAALLLAVAQAQL
jgi:hypothetical protein